MGRQYSSETPATAPPLRSQKFPRRVAVTGTAAQPPTFRLCARCWRSQIDLPVSSPLCTRSLALWNLPLDLYTHTGGRPGPRQICCAVMSRQRNGGQPPVGHSHGGLYQAGHLLPHEPPPGARSWPGRSPVRPHPGPQKRKKGQSGAIDCLPDGRVTGAGQSESFMVGSAKLC